MEVIILNFLVGHIDIAVLVGGEGIAYTSNLIAIIIIIIATICGSMTTLWYLGFVILLFIIVLISNIVLYPILKFCGSILWGLFAPSHIVVYEDYEIKRGQICGCRWLALAYAIVGGGFTLYSLFK